MYSIGEFAKKTGFTTQTLRDWDKNGKLKPAYRNINNHKYSYYSEEQLNAILQERINIGYMIVSTSNQEYDLKRQYELMKLFLTKQDKRFKIIKDIESNVDYNKRKGLKELLKFIAANRCNTIFILHKNVLPECGYALIKEFAKLHNTRITIINKDIKKLIS